MKAAGFVNYGTDLDNPDFARSRARRAVCSGPGWSAPASWRRRCGRRSRTTARRWSRCVTARQELSMPPKITLEQVKGFTLYATRTILSGGGDEIVELARTNLRELGRE